MDEEWIWWVIVAIGAFTLLYVFNVA